MDRGLKISDFRFVSTIFFGRSATAAAAVEGRNKFNSIEIWPTVKLLKAPVSKRRARKIFEDREKS